MPTFFRSLTAATPGLILAGACQLAAAQPAAHVLHAPEGTDALVRSYWTPDRILHAKPLSMRITGAMLKGHANKLVPGARQTIPAFGPTEAYDPDMAAVLYDEALVQPRAQPGHIKAKLVGGGQIPYTTNRLYPQNDTILYKVFPYSTIGQLYFSEPGGDYVCTASVIRRNVIATAGHCVNDGSGNYYSNWLFVPAENGSKAPFGSWTWADADTTSSWYGGGGDVPNDQDDAVIVLNQQQVNGRGKLRSLGDVTGYLGYEFNAPLPTAITQIGYPCNLDSCVDPIATYSQDTAGPTNNFQWGTYSYGGASGGPEIQDFGQAPSGLPSEPFGGNIVVSSTSYTYSATTEVDGGSIFYAPGQNGEYTFGDLINWACTFANAC